MKSLLDKFSRFSVLLGSLSGVATLLMILLIVPDVLLRKFANTTIPGASEASVLLLVVLAYLGMAGAQARDAHFSASFLLQRLSPAARRWIKLLTLFLSLLFVLAVAWLTANSAWQSTMRSEASFGIVRFPIWPSRIAVAFGFGLLALQIIVDIVKTWWGMPALAQTNADDGAAEQGAA